MSKPSLNPAKLTISHLAVEVTDPQTGSAKKILQDVNLIVKRGEIHALMGPNGSGKSTLAYTLAGHPFYQVITEHDEQKSQATLDNEDLFELAPDERANLGLFLAFQYPVEIPGVKVETFLRQAYKARFADQPKKLFPSALAFRNHLKELAAKLHIKPELITRGLNEGFSGGEKKRVEILQMAVLEPAFAILDETDSGLDLDAIRAVAKGIQHIHDEHKTGMVIITHYHRVLEHIKPTHVHIMKAGKICVSGGIELIDRVEKDGYGAF